MSRAKGARGELEVAKIWQAAGFDCNRTPNSGGLMIPGDVAGDVPAHVEVKWQETIRLGEWWRQTRAEAPPGVLPVLAVKLTGSRHRPKEWVAVVPLEALVQLLAAQAVAQDDQRELTPDERAAHIPGWMRGVRAMKVGSR